MTPSTTAPAPFSDDQCVGPGKPAPKRAHRTTADHGYNQSEKGRARYRRYEESPNGREVRSRYAQSEARRDSNRRRIFIGARYVGTEADFPQPRALVEQHLRALYDDFRAKQAAETDAFRAGFDPSVPSATDALVAPWPPLPASTCPDAQRVPHVTTRNSRATFSSDPNSQ